MKKFICLFLVFALCFSFSACSSDETPPATNETEKSAATTLPTPVFDSYKKAEKFKDENGRVVYTVEANIPKITKNTDEAFSEYISSYFLGIFNDACEFAKSNISNAADFMNRNSTDTPWSKRIDFEVKLSDGRFLSIVIKEYFTMFGEETEPTLKSVTLDAVSGEPLTLLDFAHKDYSITDVERFIEKEFLCPSVSFYFFNDNELTEEQIQLVRDAFNTESFYLTDDGIGFYFSEYIISSHRNGTFTCDFDWEEVAPVLNQPE